jgi:organic hydroperoxide reductase OsmC/OhrA
LERVGLFPCGPKNFPAPTRWSPETPFVAAVGDCYVLAFSAVAALFKLPRTSIDCRVDGVVDRPHRIMQLVDVAVQATLTSPGDAGPELALRVLQQATHACPITNSLKAPVILDVAVVAAAGAAA